MMMPKLFKEYNKFFLLVIIFVIFRLLIVFWSSSFIHPDEYFQSSQVAIGDIFNNNDNNNNQKKKNWVIVTVTRTWEWHLQSSGGGGGGGGPVRSIVPLAIISHLPFILLSLIFSGGGDPPSTYSLILAPRLCLFCLSILPDYLLLTNGFYKSALLLASCPLTLVFLTRPFVNSFETILLAPVFFLSLSILTPSFNNKPSSNPRLALWTFLVLFASWSRVTFIAFALPPALAIAWTRLRPSPSNTFIVAFTAFLSLTALLSLDSFYFSQWPTIPPLNLLLYNLQPHHLALHGLHPRWLHILVNGPLLFGPALWFLAAYGIIFSLASPLGKLLPNQQLPHTSSSFTLSVAVTVLSLALLSSQPHQEPRFLMPLSLPIAIIASHSLALLTPRNRRLFWIIHLLHAFLATGFYGFAHQAGLQPSLSYIQTRLNQPDGPSKVVSWKTFDIPSALLFPTRPIQFINLGSASVEKLRQTVCTRPFQETLLIAPIDLEGLEGLGTLEWRWGGIHLDPDRVADIFKGKWHLGVYNVGKCHFKAF